MKKRLAFLEPGNVFTYAKERFVVLEQTGNGVFVLLEQSKESVPFHEGSDEPRNDYRKSTLHQYITGEWLQNLIANGADEADLIDFRVDLRETDGSKGYGDIEVKAAPLTLFQYGRFKDIIPLNEDDGWWLVTPLWTPWLRSPSTSNTNYAWYVYTSGTAYVFSVAFSYGVRPALLLSSDLLVSVDGEDEDEVCEKTMSDTELLARFDTLTLIREVERRMSQQDTDSDCDSEDNDE
ncbi:MAG: hypothetical protein IJD35_01540 [Clostridia bacterium]|nr:hypothetical protein [Clostridia bacterium]